MQNQELAKAILRDLDAVMGKYIQAPNGFQALSMSLASALVSLNAAMYGNDKQKMLAEISKDLNEIVRAKSKSDN